MYCLSLFLTFEVASLAIWSYTRSSTTLNYMMKKRVLWCTTTQLSSIGEECTKSHCHSGEQNKTCT